MTATALDLSAIRTDATAHAATFRTLIGVYSEAEVDALIAGLDGLTAADIDTLAEINAILTDANLASIAYVDGLASNYATAAQGALADTALQPADITSGTITAGTGDIDFDNLGGGLSNATDVTGGVLVHTGDGSTAGTVNASEVVSSSYPLRLTAIGRELQVTNGGGNNTQLETNTGQLRLNGSSGVQTLINGTITLRVQPGAVWSEISTLGTSGGPWSETHTLSVSSPTAPLAVGNATHGADVFMRSGESDPTTLDIAAGRSAVWKNTTSGEVRQWVNDGGTLKKSAAYT